MSSSWVSAAGGPAVRPVWSGSRRSSGHTDDEKLLLDALLENLHRAQLNPLEEAAAYDQLLKDFNCTHDQLADRIGRSRPQVSNTLRLLRLSPAVQRRVAAGCALGRACAGPAFGGRLRGAGPAGAPHRGRGAVGACGRGDRDADGLEPKSSRQAEGARGPVRGCRRRSPIWPRGSRTASRRG